MVRPRSVSRRWRRASLVATCVGVAALAAPGCSDAQPPPLDNGIFSDGGGTGNPDSPPNFGFDAAPHPRDCNLGPDAGVCACTDFALLTDVPNIYVVLDGSGSMSDDNKWPTAQLVIANAVLKLGPRINVGLATFPDPGSSDTCGAGHEVMAVMHGDSPAGNVNGNTYLTLRATLLGLTPFGGTPTASTLTKLLPSISSLKGRTFVILVTDGGPNCDANAVCAVDQCIANIESAPGCAPSTQPNCCDPSLDGPLNCLDSSATRSAVAAYQAANVPVYVIGVFGSGPYASLLDQLAQAGGTARSTSPYYYRVDGTDPASFQQALFQVAAKIVASCTLQLSAVPTDPDKVNVFFDGAVLPQSGPDGWTLSGSTVTIEGASCEELLNGQVLDVNVSGGCPTVVR